MIVYVSLIWHGESLPAGLKFGGFALLHKKLIS